VKTEYIAEFVRMPDIDGALVGGASLSPAFADLVKAAGTP
jgi:triosephosphate isomerase